MQQSVAGPGQGSEEAALNAKEGKRLLTASTTAKQKAHVRSPERTVGKVGEAAAMDPTERAAEEATWRAACKKGCRWNHTHQCSGRSCFGLRLRRD